MKVDLYFDVRFIRSETEHEKCNKAGRYVPAFSRDFCYRFIRRVSIPCLPMRGQIYHLKFDPTTGNNYDSGDWTCYLVRESGLIEDGDKVVPYFIISDDNLFSEWKETDAPTPEQLEQWEAEVKERMAYLTKIFEEHGWRPEG